MGKKSKNENAAFTACPPFPKQPWIYISDPTEFTGVAFKVTEILNGLSVDHTYDNSYFDFGNGVTPTEGLLTDIDKIKDAKAAKGRALLIVEKLNCQDDKVASRIAAATKIREHAAKSGRTFVSVNVYKDDGTPERDMKKWGPNHLDIDMTGLTIDKTADRIYDWLFTVVPPTEHIHLLTQAKLQKSLKKHYPEYKFCNLTDIKKYPKDEKIQFGVVITSKPTIVPNTQRLHWTVADKSGTGNFYFQYRGPSSQYTWDWVQALQPGDIKSLPRMPSLKITEKSHVRIAKLPFRTASFAVSTVGVAVKGVGKGLVKVGDVLSMGKSSEYVPRSDVDRKTGKKIHWGKMFDKENKVRDDKVEEARKVGREKLLAKFLLKYAKTESKTLSDGEESTLRGSLYDEKNVLSEKEFC